MKLSLVACAALFLGILLCATGALGAAHSASFTYYTDHGGNDGYCNGGDATAALDDCSWLWRAISGVNQPCPAPDGVRCTCPDGSSCPHAPNTWQCDTTPGDWTKYTQCQNKLPQGCSFDACGPAGCKRLTFSELLPFNHPCNSCKTGGQCPDTGGVVRVDVCSKSVAAVCGGLQNCQGYITNISCYPN
jgi:hypothetical protein